jgi:hypothetical protein
VVAVVPLKVGVDDGHHIPALGRQVGDHVLGVGELVIRPRKIPGEEFQKNVLSNLLHVLYCTKCASKTN